MQSSGLLRRVVSQKLTDISEVLAASIVLNFYESTQCSSKEETTVLTFLL
jgi:hypothetical protein